MTEPTWFSRPAEGSTGMLNAVYDALDRQVVLGRADETALDLGDEVLSYAVLLERTAAFGGLLRALGVRRDDPVAVTAAVSAETAVAVLAAARIGAVPWVGTDPATLVSTSAAPLVVAEGVQMEVVAPAVDALDPARPRAVVVVRPEPWTLLDTRDVAWAPALKAGGTDPAEIVPVAPDSAFVVAEDGTHDHRELSVPGDLVAALTAGESWDGDKVRRLLSALRAGPGTGARG